MAELLYSGFILAVGILSLYIAGLPISYLAFRGKSGNHIDSITALSLFVGYGVITIPLQLLYVAGLPVKYSAWMMAGLCFVGFLLFVFRKVKAKEWRSLLPSWPFIIIFVFVTLIMSISYLKIGAVYYKGYNWWDNFFYGPHAEIIKEVPFPSLQTYIAQHPYAIYSGNYIFHRIARGVYQAFVAALTGVDGMATVGLLGIISTPLVFCALIYATKDIKIRKSFRYAACGFASIVPIHVSMYLEGFLVTTLFTCFITLLCKLLPDALEQPKWPKTLTVTLVLASIFSTFAEGLDLLAAFLLLSTILSLLCRPKSLPTLVHSGVIAVGTALLNLPFLSYFMPATAFSYLAPRELDGAFPFAKSAGFITSAFFGNNLCQVDNPVVYQLLVLISALLLIAGIYGLIHLFMHERRQEAFLFVTLALSPLLFLSKQTMEIYYVYKTFALAAPVIVFGAWYFADVGCTQLSTYFMSKRQSAPACKGRKLVSRAAAIVFCIIFIVSGAGSVRNTLAIIDTDLSVNFGRDANYHLDQDIDMFDQLQSLAGKNVLFCGSTMNISLWYMTYYGRDCNIYTLRDDAFDLYDKAYDTNYYKDIQQPSSIPMDSVIVFAPGEANLVEDYALSEDYAALIITEKMIANKADGGSRYSYPFELDTFAREAAEISVELTIARESIETDAVLVIDTAKEKLRYPFDEFAVTHAEPNTQTITFTLPLQQGIQAFRFSIETDDATIKLKESSADIIPVKP